MLPSAAASPRPTIRRAIASNVKGNLPFTLVWLCVLGVILHFSGVLDPVEDTSNGGHHHHHPGKAYGCQQLDPLFPSSTEKLDEAFEFLSSESFRNASILRHSGAVQLATESFDDMGEIGEDTRWDVFYPFAEYLAATFPKVHTELQLEKINTHGLLFTWQGSQTDLKPLVLMAHQDVVPVPKSTVDAWTHPPFSGFFDGKSIWGRGSTDCKNQLIAVLESVEELLTAGFLPQRTVILSFGFDGKCLENDKQ